MGIAVHLHPHGVDVRRLQRKNASDCAKENSPRTVTSAPSRRTGTNHEATALTVTAPTGSGHTKVGNECGVADVR
jgi:hypothetical protein